MKTVNYYLKIWDGKVVTLSCVGNWARTKQSLRPMILKGDTVLVKEVKTSSGIVQMEMNVDRSWRGDGQFADGSRVPIYVYRRWAAMLKKN